MICGAAGVAPHAGAWIETRDSWRGMVDVLLSHPTRVRGLKLGLAYEFLLRPLVAPHAGAWIETGAG